MGGEFRKKVYVDEHDMNVSIGTYTESNNFYNIKVADRGSRNGVYIEAEPSKGEKQKHVTYNQPKISGGGANESLALGSQDPELPETDKGIEAYARLALQPSDTDRFLDYSGPLWEDMQ